MYMPQPQQQNLDPYTTQNCAFGGVCSYSEARNSQNKLPPSEVKPEITWKRSKILGSRQVRSTWKKKTH